MLEDLVTTWTIPKQLGDFRSYGLWNSIVAYDSDGKALKIIPAHDGDFFPEGPLDHVEILRSAILKGQRDLQLSLWPVRVDIDITQKCTDECFFCYSRKYAQHSQYRNAEISAGILESILGELANGGTKSVRFTGGGEPLIHPEITKIIPMGRRYGLRSCIITNGCLLDDRINELLVSYTDHIRISMNAAISNTRGRVHRPKTQGSDLSKILQQVKQMAALRDTTWPFQKRPLIWTTFLILPENVNEIYLAAQIAKDHGADSISFRPAYHRLSREFSKQELDMIHQQMKLASSLHSPPQFQVFTPKRNIATVWEILPKTQFPKCISCHLRTIIEATNIGPMVKICGLHRGSFVENLGVLDEGISFAKLWSNPDTHNILANREKICQRCIDISMNITLNLMWETLLKYPNAVFKKAWVRATLLGGERGREKKWVG